LGVKVHGLTYPCSQLAPLSPTPSDLCESGNTHNVSIEKSEYFLLFVAEINSYLGFENRFSTAKDMLYYPVVEFLFILNASFLLNYPALIKQIHLLDSVNFV